MFAKLKGSFFGKNEMGNALFLKEMFKLGKFLYNYHLTFSKFMNIIKTIYRTALTKSSSIYVIQKRADGWCESV